MQLMRHNFANSNECWSLHVLLTGEESSLSPAFDFQQQGRVGSCVCSHTVNVENLLLCKCQGFLSIFFFFSLVFVH